MAERLTKTELMQQVKECIEKWLVGHAHVLYDMQRLVDGWVAIKEQQNMDEMKVLKFFQDIDSMPHMNFYEVTFVYMKAKLSDFSEEYFQGHYFPETNELRYHFNRSCDIRINILREAIKVQEKIVSKWRAFDMRNDHILKAYANAFASGTLHGVKDFETSFIGSLPPAPHKLEIDYEDNDPYTSYVPDVGSVLEQVKTTRFNPEEFNLNSSGERISKGIFNGFLKKILIRNNALKNAIVYPVGLDYWNRKIDEYNENLIFAINEFHSPVLLFCVRSALNITPPAPKGWKGIFCLLDESEPFQSMFIPFPIVSVGVATPKSKSWESMALVTPGENVRVPIVQQDQETTSGPRRDEESFEMDHSQEDLRVQQATPVSMSSQDVNVHVPNVVESTEKEEKSFEVECPHEVPNAEQHQETTPVSTRSDGIYFVFPNIEEKTEKEEESSEEVRPEMVVVAESAEVSQNPAAVSKKQMKKIEKEKKKQAREEKARKHQEDLNLLEAARVLSEIERNAQKEDVKKGKEPERDPLPKRGSTTHNAPRMSVRHLDLAPLHNAFNYYYLTSPKMPDNLVMSLASKFVDLRLQALAEISEEDLQKDPSLLDIKNSYMDLQKNRADGWQKDVQLQLCMLNSKYKKENFRVLEKSFFDSIKLKNHLTKRFNESYDTKQSEHLYEQLLDSYIECTKNLSQIDQINKAHAFLVGQMEKLEKEFGSKEKTAEYKHGLYEKLIETYDGHEVEEYIIMAMCMLSENVDEPSFPELESVFMDHLQQMLLNNDV